MFPTQRNTTMISALGATIIFGTFLFREAKQEQFKSINNAINDAENTLITRMASRRTFAELKRFEDDFSKIEGNLNVSESFKTAKESGAVFSVDSDDLDSIRDGALYLKAISARSDRLNTYLPDADGRRADLQEIGNLDVWKEWSALVERKRESYARPERKAAMEQDLFFTLGVLNSRLKSASEKLDDITADVIKNAQVLRTETRNRYEAWKSRFYVFFAVGWVLCISGFFLNVRAAGPPASPSSMDQGQSAAASTIA